VNRKSAVIKRSRRFVAKKASSSFLVFLANDESQKQKTEKTEKARPKTKESTSSSPSSQKKIA
jgi:hypothetical protein